VSQAKENSSQVGSEQWLALAAIIIGTFVAVLNSSLLNVALPKLVTVFGSTTDTMQWVLTGYMLASAVVIPLSGYLGDKFGYKKILLLSITGFTAGCFLCGLAWSDTSMIAFRILTGLAGGLIMPVGMSIIYMIIPRDKIGMALGLWGISSMSAPAIGPTLSGYLVQYFSWRLLFFLSVPLGILAIVMTSILLKETPKKPNAFFDKMGTVLSMTAFGTILLALSKGQSEGWTSLYIVSLLFTGFFSLILFIWVELGQEQPLMDLRLFKIPEFSLSVITSGLVTMGMFGGIFLMPIYLQNILGMSAIQTGLLLMPQSIAMALMMPLSGRLFDKVGVVPLGVVGLAIVGITTYDLHLLEVNTPTHWLNILVTIRGIGIGLCMMPLSTVGMNAVPKHLVGRASPLSNVIRQVLGSLSIAILTAIMTTRATWHGAVIAEGVSVTNDTANQTLQMLSATLAQGGLDAASAQAAAMSTLGGVIQQEAMVRAIGDAFFISAMPVFACIPLVFFYLRKKKAPSAPAPAPAPAPVAGQKALEPAPGN
jgi:EmrB/QacA subfamily drug resistance transporter